jgi:HlyD family secretion protein
MTRKTAHLIALALAAACHKEAPPPVYLVVPAEHRDIIVSAQAAGTIQPDTTVEVKSKASGEILEIRVSLGDLVKRGSLMVKVDPRQPKNDVDQAQAQLDVAKAKLANATAQKRRADELFESRSITETEHDSAMLDFANAKSDVVSAQVALENARIQLEDTEVRSPVTGTVIESDVSRGQVISSPTKDVGGGTVLLKMADLNLVQVRTLVDETDIGKISPGLPTTITVDAYPNRPFQGSVLKIEPQATVQQNVTMFGVIVRIENREGLLRPGMNTEVEIHVGRRDSVLAVPNAALRTQKDVSSAADVLGLSLEDVQMQLAAQRPHTDSTSGEKAPADSQRGKRPAGADSSKRTQSAGGSTEGRTMTTPDGRTIQLPKGVTEEQVRAIFAKFRQGQTPTPEERAILQQIRSQGGFMGGNRQRTRTESGPGASYIVFVLRSGKPTPVAIRTGLTDLDYSEVLSGLAEGDSVLILPSASLVKAQQDFQNRIGRMTGGGLPGLRQQPSGGQGTQRGQ